MTDELMYKFNYGGIKKKLKLEDKIIMKIVHGNTIYLFVTRATLKRISLKNCLWKIDLLLVNLCPAELVESQETTKPHLFYLS